MTISEKIKKLKKERNAVILVHNYQLPEIQDIADFLGDSLELSIKASQTEADIIVFCGVHFMAETASILSPNKTVLLPELEAGCPMADMINVEALKQMQSEYPSAKTVCYVNSSAAVKAHCDVCCTSSNAVEVVRSLGPQAEIIFVPDQYLASYVSKVLNKELIIWRGYCPSHVKILKSDIDRQKELHPGAVVLVHPESTPDVIDISDAAVSTFGMCKYVKESDANDFIIGTEVGIIYRLKRENPGKNFYAASELAVCTNMKSITLEKVLWALEDMKNVIKVPEDVRVKAKNAVDKMIRIRKKS